MCAVVQKTHDDSQERALASLVRGSNWEHLVQQGVRLQLAADHINSTVKTVSDFDALGQSSLLTASGDDSNEGKKICVKIIFDPRDISMKFLLVGFVGNFCPPYFLAYLCSLDFLHGAFTVAKQPQSQAASRNAFWHFWGTACNKLSSPSLLKAGKSQAITVVLRVQHPCREIENTWGK